MSRRAAGEGSVYERQDGRWVATLPFRGYGGKRMVRSFYGKTQREAIALRRDARRHLDLGLELGPERLTVGKYLSGWLERVRPTLRASTHERYEGICRLHLIPSLGHSRIRDLTPAHVENLLRDRLAAGMTPRGIHHLRAVLRTALARAVRDGLVLRNAASLASLPTRVPNLHVEAIDQDEANRIMRSVRDEVIEHLVTVALLTGARQGELLGLHWADVDLDEGTIMIRYSLRRGEIGEPKTERSRRSLAVGGRVVAALRAQRVAQARSRLLGGSRWIENDLVFTSNIGTPMDATNVTHRLQRALSAAGLQRRRFHDLRHAAATLLLASGADIKVVSDYLGHQSIATTANIYAHVLPEVQRRAVERLEASLVSDTA